MHELGVAQSVLDIVRTYVPMDQAGNVREVRLRVGDRAGVLIESLEFCFGVAVAGTPFAGAALAVDRVTGDDLQVVHVDLADGKEAAS